MHYLDTVTGEKYPIRMKTKLLICLMWSIAICSASYGQTICAIPDNPFPQDSLIICKDTSFQLILNLYPGAKYTWNTGETDTAINILWPGKYWIKIDDGKCVKSDTVHILFNSNILAPETDTNILCFNTKARELVAMGSNLKWYDTLPIGGNPSVIAPIPKTNQLGEKTYYVSQTIMGCESPRAALVVEVIEKPRFHLGENILIPCGASGISLQVVEEKYTTYRWGNGTAGPVYVATRPGTYVLRGNNLCGSKADTIIAVNCETKCVHFPSAFTPDGDGLNDVFRATSFCPMDKFILVISNRFGEIIFETRNPKDNWNGMWKGKPMPVGTYVFYCQYIDFVLKKDIFFKGSIQLMR